MEVLLENRRCCGCEKMYRVMQKSAQSYCSRDCELGTAGHGAQKKPSIKRDGKTSIVNVETMIATKTKSTPGAGPGWDVTQWRKKKPSEQKNEPTTEKTKGDAMSAEVSGPEKTKSASSPIREKTTTSEGLKTLEKSTKAGTAENPIESLDVLSPSIEVASLDILNLSRSSANRLMRLMKESVSDTDLDRSAAGGERVAFHKIQSAIQCANAITGIVQTNVNLLRALGKR